MRVHIKYSLVVVLATFGFSAFASEPAQAKDKSRELTPAATSYDDAAKVPLAEIAVSSLECNEVTTKTEVAVNQPTDKHGPADESPSCIVPRRSRMKRVLLRMIAEIAKAAAQ